MKRAVAVSHILSWANLIIGGFLALCLLFTIAALPPAAVLLSVALMGFIVLHSYASLQLRKSILNPGVPLNKQTPVGIRMMGAVSIVFSFMLFTDAIIMVQNAKDLLKQIPMPAQVKQADLIGIVHLTGVFILVFTTSIILNVLLNFRLLKWYLITAAENNNDAK
jgi:hypothetical protein